MVAVAEGEVELGNGIDDLTPITDMRGMGVALTIIRRDVSEMKPEVKATAIAVVELSTKQRVADKRIKTLETGTARIDRKTVALASTVASPQPHECLSAEKISDLEKSDKVNSLALLDVKKDAAATGTDVDELEKGQSKFIYWLMGAAVIVVGSVVGWYASYSVTRNEVSHLTREQVKLRTSMDSLQKTTRALPAKLNTATDRVEAAAERIKTNGHSNGGVQLEEVWCIISEREKVRLKRQLSAEKIPTQRCRR